MNSNNDNMVCDDATSSKSIDEKEHDIKEGHSETINITTLVDKFRPKIVDIIAHPHEVTPRKLSMLHNFVKIENCEEIDMDTLKYIKDLNTFIDDDYFQDLVEKIGIKIDAIKIDRENLCPIKSLFRQLQLTNLGSSDFIKNYEILCELINIPFGVNKSIEYNYDIIKKLSSAFDEKICCRTGVKHAVMASIIKRLPKISGVIIFSGAPSSGKTLFIETLCSVLGRPVYKSVVRTDTSIVITTDELINATIKNKCLDGIFIFKMCNTKKHLDGWHSYMTKVKELRFAPWGGITLDLSEMLFIVELDDAIEEQNLSQYKGFSIINFPKYTIDDKICIAQERLIPKLLAKYELDKISVGDDLLQFIIHNRTDNENGIAKLETILDYLISSIKVRTVIGSITCPMKLSRDVVNEIMSDITLTNSETEATMNLSCHLFN